jgi:hypothetical protein
MFNTFLAQLQLTNTTALIYILGALVAMLVVPRFLPKSLIGMRKMPQIDGMKEAMRACAEKGVPAVYSLGGVYPDDIVWGRDCPACFEVGKMLAKMSAELDVPLYTSCSNGLTYMLLQDYIRQGYVEAGAAEKFKIENVKFYGGGMSPLTYGTLGLVEDHKAGALLIWGNFGFASHTPILEVAYRRGLYIVQGETYANEAIMGSFFTDLTAVAEEQTVSGAYVTNDMHQQAIISTEDMIKIVVGIVLVAYGLLVGMGVV